MVENRNISDKGLASLGIRSRLFAVKMGASVKEIRGNTLLFGVLVYCALFGFSGFLDAREFTSKDGRKIEADIVDVRENSSGVLVVELRRSDRRYFTIPVDQFAAADQRFLRDYLKDKEKSLSLLHPDDRIDLNLKKNRKEASKDVTASHYWGGQTSDEKHLYRPQVIITNDELTKSMTGNKIRIVVIAKHTRDDGKLLIASACTESVDIPAKGSVTVEADPFFLREYEYRSGYYSNYHYEYGYEIEDYVIVLMNSKGEVTHTRASSNGLLEHLDKVMSCKAGETYSKNLEFKSSEIVDSSYYSKGSR